MLPLLSSSPVSVAVFIKLSSILPVHSMLLFLSMCPASLPCLLPAPYLIVPKYLPFTYSYLTLHILYHCYFFRLLHRHCWPPFIGPVSFYCRCPSSYAFIVSILWCHHAFMCHQSVINLLVHSGLSDLILSLLWDLIILNFSSLIFSLRSNILAPLQSAAFLSTFLHFATTWSPPSALSDLIFSTLIDPY